MPMLRVVLDQLNRSFDTNGIKATARQAEKFAQGQKLDFTFLLQKSDANLVKLLQAYVDQAPTSMRESLRAAIYHALKQSPPVPINFAWQPSYASELNIWEVDCGISVVWKVPRLREGATPRGGKKR